MTKYIKYGLLYGGALVGLLESNIGGLQPVLPPHVFAITTAVVPILYGMIEFAERQLQGAVNDEQ